MAIAAFQFLGVREAPDLARLRAARDVVVALPEEEEEEEEEEGSEEDEDIYSEDPRMRVARTRSRSLRATTED